MKIKSLLAALFVFTYSINSFANFNGSYSVISGNPATAANYQTIKAVIEDLNGAVRSDGGPSNGPAISGAVIFEVAVGHTEIFSNLICTASGTASNTITIRRNPLGGAGANPKITAGVGIYNPPGSSPLKYDSFIALKGASYITIDGIDLDDPASNANQTTQMDMGYVFLKSSPTNGCQHNTIKNCTISLQGRISYGIKGTADSSLTAVSQAVTTTSFSGTNSYNTFENNTISNCMTAIDLVGYKDGASPYRYFDHFNIATNNTINCASTTGFVGMGATGIKFGLQDSATICSNSIASAFTGVLVGTKVVIGIYFSDGTTANYNVSGDIYNNTISNVSTTATLGTVVGIYATAGSAGTGTTNKVSIYNNNIQQMTAPSGAVYGLFVTGSFKAVEINDNTISNISALAGTGTFMAIYNQNFETTSDIHGNFIRNNTLNKTGDAFGIKISTNTTGNSIIYDNTISNNIHNSNYYAIGINSTTGTFSVYGNSIFADSSYTATAIVRAIDITGGTTINTYNNKIYNLSASGSSATVSGIAVTGGTTNTVYNNMVSNLKAPQANVVNAINGLYLNGGTTISVYYNSIYLSPLTASAGTNFGTSGIYTNTTPNITLKNNLVVNNAIAAGTGKTVAHRRSAASVANLTADYNSYLASSIGYDGATNYASLATYQAWATSESHSISVDPGFLDLTDLHQAAMSSATLIQSVGIAIAGISADIDSDNRNGNGGLPPDIGYDEVLNILPIELLTFTGSAQSTSNLLEWSTATEQNNNYFTLERSTDGITFDSIVTINTQAPNGNSSVQLNYSYTDGSIANLPATLYYRLKQTDINGVYNHSNIISITRLEAGIQESTTAIQLTNIYPNPASNNFNYSINSTGETEINVSIIDVLGREVQGRKLEVGSGVNNLNMNVSTLSRGNYLIQVSTLSGYKTQKQLIVK